MRRLLVYLNDEHVGALDQDDSGLLLFRYAPSWLNRPDAMPLSRSLPLREDPFRGKYARSFFAGVLPEETPRRRIASILGISERNDFAMLERIGGECAGAVTLFPDDAAARPEDAEALHELGEGELKRVFAELPQRPLMAGKEGVRLSLAGAQGKLPVVVRGGSIYLPLNNTASTHILKPEPERFPGLAANESFCMSLAAEAGLNVPPVEMRNTDGLPYLVIERFDRDEDKSGRVRRIHQEDFCQALGYPPEHKYQQEGGPLLRHGLELLRDWSTEPVLDVLGLVDTIIFNAVIGNADAHGKNFSILYRGHERRLAPAYDLVCTLAWSGISTRLAMNIGGCRTLTEIKPDHWRRMAGETGLAWPMLRERVTRFATEIGEAACRLRENLSVQDPMIDRVAEIIASRADRIGSGRG